MLPPVEARRSLLEHSHALPAERVSDQAPSRGDALRLLESGQALDGRLSLGIHLAGGDGQDRGGALHESALEEARIVGPGGLVEEIVGLASRDVTSGRA
jgi:hypothetical protein